MNPMSEFILNQYFVALITTGVINVGLCILVVMKDFNRPINRIFAFYSLSLALWSIFEAFAITSNNASLALLLWRINHVGVIFIPVFLTHFIYLFLNIHTQQKILIPILYVAAFVFLLANATPLFISSVVPKFSFRYFINPGYLYYPFLIFWFGLAVHGNVELLKELFKVKGYRKKQIKLFIWAMLLSYVGGVPNFLPTFNIELLGIMPYGTYAIPLYAIIAAYSIVRYHLIDIRLAITRLGIFLCVYLLVLGIPFGLAGIGKDWLVGTVGANWHWIPMVLLLILATAGPFIYSFIQNKAEEKILENEKRIQDLLSKVSFGMTTIKEINRLLALIVDVIRKTLGINHVDVYLKDNNQYLLKASNNGHLLSLPFALDNPLIGHLQRDYNVLVYEELQQASIPRKDDILQKLESLSAKIVVPFTLQNNLLGFLVLGQRNNKEVYSQYIVNALRVMGDQIALAIENCQFLSAEKEMLKKEGARARRESLDMLVSTMAHEIDNPITSVIGHADIISEYIQNNKAKISEEDYSEIIKSANYVMKDAARVSKIIKAVEDYSKGGEGKLKEISFYDALDPFRTLLTLVKKKVSGVHYTEEIEPSLPSIMAEQILIEEILLNFSENAFHAVRENTGAKNVMLKVFNKNNFLRIEMIDNGYGIPQNILKQLFEVPTTTKGSSEGTGIGLYRIRQICNILKAKYGAESKGPGQGALLYVEIPFIHMTRGNLE